MDNMIANGDMVISAGGSPEMVSGLQELIQRAMIRLTVAKGSFPYDMELGSTITRLDLNQTDEFVLLAAVRDALSDLSEVTVSGVEKSVDRNTQTLYLTVYLNIRGREAMLELNQQLW